MEAWKKVWTPTMLPHTRTLRCSLLPRQLVDENDVRIGRVVHVALDIRPNLVIVGQVIEEHGCGFFYQYLLSLDK